MGENELPPPPEDNERSEDKNFDREITKWSVIQDFNNKKANSHATIFVASMFALFTVLTLAQRIVTRGSVDYILILSLASYILIWLFGGYSILNFSYYSTVSQRAEEQIVDDMERQLVISKKASWNWLLRKFSNYKVPSTNKGKGRMEKIYEVLNHKNLYFFAVSYFLIGLLPLVSFMIWFFCLNNLM